MQDMTLAEIDQVAGAATSTLNTLLTQVESAAAQGDYPAASLLVKSLYLQQEFQRQNDAAWQGVLNKI